MRCFPEIIQRDIRLDRGFSYRIHTFHPREMRKGQQQYKLRRLYLTLCICEMTSVWEQLCKAFPLISNISSATSKSALSAGEPGYQNSQTSSYPAWEYADIVK